MGQALSGRFREHVHDLKANAQNRVRRHRTVRPDPGIRGFTLQIFRYENEVIVLKSNIKNAGQISVIQLLRHSRVFFESDALHFINTGKRDELHRHNSTAVVTDRFIGKDGAVARDLARRSIVVQTDRIVFGKHSLPLIPVYRATTLRADLPSRT